MPRNDRHVHHHPTLVARGAAASGSRYRCQHDGCHDNSNDDDDNDNHDYDNENNSNKDDNDKKERKKSHVSRVIVIAKLPFLLLFVGVAIFGGDTVIHYALEEHFFHDDVLFNRNVTVYQLNDNTTARPRGRFTAGPIEPEFISDLQTLYTQLQQNYHHLSSCRRYPMNTTYENGIDMCYGLGTTVGRINHYVLTNNMNGIVLTDLDNFTCHWFEQDNTKECITMFGDCYFPALSSKSYDNDNNDIQNDTVHICHDINWFGDKYGNGGLHAGHLSWLLSDYKVWGKDHQQQQQQQQKQQLQLETSDNSNNLVKTISSPYEPENCIALHIRRGDACKNEKRKCFEYDTYYNVVKTFVHRYPELQHIVVLTDDDAFPQARFQSLVKNELDYSNSVNRSKYQVPGKAPNATFGEWFRTYAPEFRRDLNNSASELFQEVSRAIQCKVLVGTFTSGISKWIYLLLMTRQGRLPMFYSLHGCMINAFYWEQCWEDDDCEFPLF